MAEEAVEHYYQLVKRHLERKRIWPRVALKSQVIRRAIRRILEIIPEDVDPEELDWGSLFEKIEKFENADDFVNELIERRQIPVKPEVMLERRYSELERELTEIEMTARGLIDYLRERGIDEGVEKAIEELEERAKKAIETERELITSRAEREKLERMVKRMERELKRLRREAARRPPAPPEKPPERVPPPPPKAPPPRVEGHYHVVMPLPGREVLRIVLEDGRVVTGAPCEVIDAPPTDSRVREALELGFIEPAGFSRDEYLKLKNDLRKMARRLGAPRGRAEEAAERAIEDAGKVGWNRPISEFRADAEKALETIVRRMRAERPPPPPRVEAPPTIPGVEAFMAGAPVLPPGQSPYLYIHFVRPDQRPQFARTYMPDLMSIPEGYRLLMMLYPFSFAELREYCNPNYILGTWLPEDLAEQFRTIEGVDAYLRYTNRQSLREWLRWLIRQGRLTRYDFEAWGLMDLWREVMGE